MVVFFFGINGTNTKDNHSSKSSLMGNKILETRIKTLDARNLTEKNKKIDAVLKINLILLNYNFY